SLNSEEPNANPKGQEQKLSQEENDQQKFQLLVHELFDSYDPETVLEEENMITVARALWLKSKCRESNLDTRRLDQEISIALTHLAKSQAIRRARELRSSPTGIMSNIRRKNPHWGLIRRSEGPQARAHRQSSRETIHLLAPPTGGPGFGNGLPADAEEARER